MEGLEATEILFSDLRKRNIYLRIDSEYQSKYCLSVKNKLLKINSSYFEEFNPTIIHPKEILREYIEEDGIWFFRAQNIRKMYINESSKVFLSKEDADSLAQNVLIKNDVVMTRTGANAGDCALFNEESAIASSHAFIIRTKNIDHNFITAFFNSKYGREQILTGRYGAVQPEISPYYLRNILIPSFKNELVNLIKKSFSQANEFKAKAQYQNKKAEQLLMGILGLENWQPTPALSYERKSSEVFAAGRLDAEYFHPEKASAVYLLNQLECGKVKDMFESVRELWQPETAIKTQVVQNYDLTDALSPF